MYVKKKAEHSQVILDFKAFFGAAVGSFGVTRMFGAVDMAGFGPEGRIQTYKFQD
jgi:hypothetical protein